MTDAANLITILNQYRAAELRGAGVILRLGRLADTTACRRNLTRHLRDEGVHAWLWTKAIDELGGEIVDVDDPYQTRLAAHYGLPRTLEELLAVTLVSEERGVAEYTEQLSQGDTPASVRQKLRTILKDETWHVSWIRQELERRAATRLQVQEALERARRADRSAIAELRGSPGWGGTPVA